MICSAGHLNFLGEVLVNLFRSLLAPRMSRLHELIAQFEQVGVNAIPVVALVTFLIGVVIAYMLGLQAEKYGANIFVVDGVGMGMTREFAPMHRGDDRGRPLGRRLHRAARSMRLTEEIDAIRTLGLSPMQVLVLPRVLALMVALPLLVFVGDVVGLARRDDDRRTRCWTSRRTTFLDAAAR